MEIIVCVCVGWVIKGISAMSSRKGRLTSKRSKKQRLAEAMGKKGREEQRGNDASSTDMRKKSLENGWVSSILLFWRRFMKFCNAIDCTLLWYRIVFQFLSMYNTQTKWSNASGGDSSWEFFGDASFYTSSAKRNSTQHAGSWQALGLLLGNRASDFFWLRRQWYIDLSACLFLT